MRAIIIGVLFISMFTACKSKKKLTGNNRNVDTALFSKSQNGKDSLLRQNWEYLSTRIAVDYFSSEEDQSFNLSLRMRRDSIIWFSVSAIAGIQVMKGIVTRDSVKALDLFNKKYYCYGISSLGNRFGSDIGLSALQNLFIGNPILDSLTYMKDSASSSWVAINPPVSNVVFTKDFSIPDSTLLSQKGTQRQLKATYNGSLSAGKLIVAQFMELKAISASNTVRLQMEFKNASDGFIPSYPFTVPSGYDLVNEE